MYHKPVCVKCQCELRPEKVGVSVLDMFNPSDKAEPQPYQLWGADIYKCPKCKYEIIIGFANLPYAIHSQPDFSKVLEQTSLYKEPIIKNFP